MINTNASILKSQFLYVISIIILIVALPLYIPSSLPISPFEENSVDPFYLLFRLHFFEMTLLGFFQYSGLINFIGINYDFISHNSGFNQMLGYGSLLSIIYVYIYKINKNVKPSDSNNSIKSGMFSNIKSNLFSIIYLVLFFSYHLKNTEFTKDANSNCEGLGNQNCIERLRDNYSNSGKQILSEVYLGDGRFKISFLDITKGAAFNSEISTNCNCEITNISVSVIR